MRKYRSILLVFLVQICLFAQAIAQCPMCRMSAEANLKEGGKTAAGLNAGILYMLAMPYILVGCIGYWWYQNRKKNQVVDTTPEEI